ncbi:MAG: cytochrome c biogenesis protein ResB [Pyrinomonadaceae bacterium]
MSSLQESVVNVSAKRRDVQKSRRSVVDRFLELMCSVRFGVVLLIALGILCMIGMLIMQQNVDGFERYFAELTPAQKLVYGKLGFFDIYHVWYFNALLALLSINIILSSIDRFPKAWKFIARPNVVVPVRWLREQKASAEARLDVPAEEAAARIGSAMRRCGWKRVRTGTRGGRTFVFGESGVWNRLGAYAVHVGLLVIFLGGFMTGQMGSTGNVPLGPGESTSLMYETTVELDRTSQVTKQLPFEIVGTDIQQKLIKKDGPINAMNTIDWITRFKIRDETGEHDAMVQMNRPFDYRGYRFFQASFVPVGRARTITINAVPAGGGEAQAVTIPRDGSATLADGTVINFKEFRGAFSIGQEDPNEDTSTYPNPGAILQVVPAGGGSAETAYAFGPEMTAMPVAKKPVAGYTFELVDFEKVGDQHVLSVQRDPGATVVYVGFVILCVTLAAVFFFSHQRVWAAIEPSADGTSRIVFGGHTNRNHNPFEERFRSFVDKLTASGPGSEVSSAEIPASRS